MKITEFLKEGDVIAFPTHRARRAPLMKKLAKASSKYTDDGERIDKYVIADDNFIVHAEFNSQKAAAEALPELMMKTGRRDLYVTTL